MKGTGRLVASIAVVAILVGAAAAGLATTFRPLLGLDLVGGVSVILAGPEGTERGVMEKALDTIRNRVDAVGVAEPDISLLGNNLIQVQLPGLGGQGKVVRRQGDEPFCAYSSAGRLLDCYAEEAQAQAATRGQSVQRVLNLIGRTARLEQREVLQFIPPGDPAYKKTKLTPQRTPEASLQKRELVTYEDTNGNGRFDDGVDPKYKLGKVELSGADLSRAQAQYIGAGSDTTVTNPGWRVSFTLNREGSTKFGAVTKRLVGKQLAIVLDRVVQSAPSIEEPITGGQGEITGGFSEKQAKDLALILQSGALPVELEREEVQTVSPTLGKESLQRGLIAGIAGLVALALYLAYYYRLLGVVTWFGMAIWGVLAIGLVALLGRTVGYALTLAGVAGIIVSLGVTADSYIVFYERLKDEVRGGRTLRSAVGPAFKRSWRTIIAADVVTILGAAVLYVLAVGSVRGFALTLGLSTALDMFVVFFFKRPAVFLIARSRLLSNLRGVGLRSGVAADPVPAIAGAER